jgi:hypothetical protein
LLKRVHAFDGGEEPDLFSVMLDGLDAESGRDVGLACARSADQDDVVGAVDELAPMQLADHGLVDLAGGEGEPCQVLVGREARGLEVIGDGPDFAFSDLGLQQLRQDRHGRFEGGRALFDEVLDGITPQACLRHYGHPVHLQAAHHDDDGGAGGIMTHGAPPASGCAGRHGARHSPLAPR